MSNDPFIPTVYLDTQDFSRFGDVIRGKSDKTTEDIFLRLENLSKAGEVIFPMSMPLLAELLQYNPNYRETTMCKAQAVERLCGEWALAYPTRLVAYEIAVLARELDKLPNAIPISVLSRQRYWYPNVSEVFINLKQQLQNQIANSLGDNLKLNRANKRKSAKLIKKLNFADLIASSSADISLEFGLPKESVNNSIVSLLRGNRTPEEASRILFGAIAAPTTFVQLYFEKTENDRSLPIWLSGLGEQLGHSLHKLRTDIQPDQFLAHSNSYHDAFFSHLRDSVKPLIRNFVDRVNFAEFGIPNYFEDEIIGDEIFLSSLPSSNVFGNVIVEYIKQIIGLSGTHASIERSFGGDLIHALYVPHVDLWRGDRRFSQIIRKALPFYAERVVPTIGDLPQAIDGLLTTKQPDER